jgi:hypothetical protein
LSIIHWEILHSLNPKEYFNSNHFWNVSVSTEFDKLNHDLILLFLVGMKLDLKNKQTQRISDLLNIIKVIGKGYPQREKVIHKTRCGHIARCSVVHSWQNQIKKPVQRFCRFEVYFSRLLFGKSGGFFFQKLQPDW